MSDERVSAREPYAYETASGQTLYLHPVRRVLLGKIEKKMESEWAARGKQVTLPKRRFQTFGGDWDEETLDPTHIDETLEGIEDESERQKLEDVWRRYRRDRKEFNEAVLERQVDVMFARGVTFDMPEDETWAEEQEAIGIEVPTDPHKRRAHYLTTELLYEDEVGVVVGILQTLTLGHIVEPEDLDAFMSIFRRSTGRSNRDTLARLTDIVRHLEAVVESSSPIGNAGSEVVGDKAEPVG